MSSLNKTNETYYIMYRLNGKQFRKNLGKVTNTVARTLLRKFEDDLANVKLGLATQRKISLADFKQEYFAWSANEQAPNTVDSKRTSCAHLETFLSKSKLKWDAQLFYLHEITSSVIERYKHHRSSMGIANRTINLELAFISNLIRKADDWGHLVAKVKIGMMRETSSAPRFFSREEIETLKTYSTPHMLQVINLGLDTGMRIGEMLALRWDHVDFKRNCIHVTNTAEFKTKNRQDRDIPMTPFINGYLRWLKQNHIESGNSQITERSEDQSNYVICNESGQPYSRVVKGFTQLLKRVSLNGASLHTLRHTFASHFIMVGGDLPSLKELLGHKDIKTTMIYAHLSDEHKRKSIEKLSSVTNTLQSVPDLRLVA